MNALEQAINMAKQKGTQIAQGVGTTMGNVINQAKNAPQAVTNFIDAQPISHDYPYRLAELSNRAQKAVKFNIPYQEDMAPGDQLIENMWQKASPTGQMAVDAILGNHSDGWQPTSGSSGEMLPYQLARPESPEGRTQRMAAIQNMGVYPGLANYLQTIPISTEKYDQPHIMGMSISGMAVQPYITLAEKTYHIPDKGMGVTHHEMLHQAVGAFGVEKLSGFVDAVNQAVKNDPEKYGRIVSEWMGNYKRGMPEYFQQNPTAEANELFAEMGSIFGQDILNDPVLGPYYKNVFQPPVSQKVAQTKGGRIKAR